MSVSGTPGTTYDDGFPKAHPSLPPCTRRSGRGVGQRRTLVELTDDHGRPQACRRKVGGTQSLQVAHERLAPRVVDPTVSTAERAGGVGGALGNPSSYVVTGIPATDSGRWARQSDRVSQGPTGPARPVDRRRLGRHSFELRHYDRDGALDGDVLFGPFFAHSCDYSPGGGSMTPSGISFSRHSIILALVVAVAVLGATAPIAAQQPSGQAVMAWHVTIAPSWFDPSTAPPQITPFGMLYAIHDALVRPYPGQKMGPSLAE